MRCALLLLGILFAPAVRADIVSVSSVDGLVRAIQRAQPGDQIVLADGTYRLSRKVAVSSAGTADARIIVRAAAPLRAVIEVSTEIGFEVAAEFWTFRDLEIRGVCVSDDECEHAFHVIGGGNDFEMRNNRISDFNAHLKVNATSRTAPARGLVEGNEIFNTHARQTSRPVALLNIDTSVDWVVRGNLIYDFQRVGGVAYGAFVKSGSERPVMERNLVMCRRNSPAGDARVGLSFGGGGTSPAFCGPAFDANVPCLRETIGGIMRNNIVANCSDVGIYINAAPDSAVLFNTLIRTRGIDFRFPTSTGEARGNLMASDIRTRDGGSFRDGGNMTRMLSGDLEDMYQDPDAGDLRLKGPINRIAGKGGQDPRVVDDFCGRRRTAPYDVGALQSSAGDCRTLR